MLFVDRTLRVLLSLGGGAVNAILRCGAHHLADAVSARGAQPARPRAAAADAIRAETPSQGSWQTVTFGIDGQSYQIDLDTKKADELRAALQRYVSAARRIDDHPARPSVTGGTRPTPRTGQTTLRQDKAAIRAWAQTHGHRVADRGRIPATVLQAYDAAHPRSGRTR